ncbi:hypothetical protein VU06_01225 [Desulfobulbus sp. F3]|nr:hypothetical protein [Desulfobulbus sp. F3]
MDVLPFAALGIGEAGLFRHQAVVKRGSRVAKLVDNLRQLVRSVVAEPDLAAVRVGLAFRQVVGIIGKSQMEALTILQSSKLPFASKFRFFYIAPMQIEKT